jgi:hypothetical protein
MPQKLTNLADSRTTWRRRREGCSKERHTTVGKETRASFSKEQQQRNITLHRRTPTQSWIITAESQNVPCMTLGGVQFYKRKKENTFFQGITLLLLRREEEATAAILCIVATLASLLSFFHSLSLTTVALLEYGSVEHTTLCCWSIPIPKAMQKPRARLHCLHSECKIKESTLRRAPYQPANLILIPTSTSSSLLPYLHMR